MSNKGEPWRKFVQTFFLAEQPNGYFVLNDIFRFLKEETVEGDDVGSEPEVETAAAPESPIPAPEPVVESAPPPAPEPVPSPSPSPEPVEEPPTTVIPEPIAATPAPEPTPQTANGVHADSPEPEPPLPAPEPVAEPRAPSPPPVAAPPAPAAAPPAPPAAAPSPAPSQPAAPPAPTQPSAPPAPKTWANLAATNSKKWGSNVAQESRGTTEVPASPATPASGTQTPASSGSGAPPRHNHANGNNTHPAIQNAQSITTAQVFVKGVTDPVSQAQLTQVLSTRFGPIKDNTEVVRSKACAFLEFTTVDAARRAIIASLPHSQGGEGGIRIDVGGEAGNVRISVETRKERGDRPVSRPRGGPPVNGGERGGARGRGGPGGRGRPGPGGAK